MGERALTSKQKKFAQLLAGGSSKVAAFRGAYPGGPRTKGTEWVQAKRTARVPRVAAEVHRLTMLNVAGQVEQVAARLIELSKNPDPGIALKAIAEWGKLVKGGALRPPATAHNAQSATVRHVETDRVIDELIALAAEAQHQADPLLLLTPEPDSDGQLVDIEAEEMAPMLDMGEPPVRSLLPPAGQDDAVQPLQPQAQKEDAVYEWKPLPGYFGKSRCIRVRIR
jgi:hypothetical protein